IVFGSDRGAAIERLERALLDFTIEGLQTNLPLLLWIARDEAFRAGETTTRFLDTRLNESLFARRPPPREAVLLCAAGLLSEGRAPWRVGGVSVPLRLRSDDSRIELFADARGAGLWQLSGDFSGKLVAHRRGDTVQGAFDGAPVAGTFTYEPGLFTAHQDGQTWRFTFAAPPDSAAAGSQNAAAGGASVVAPMPGKIVKVAVSDGDRVEEHALLVVLEAMKMEHRIAAGAGATVKSVLVKEGQIVSAGAPLVELG
ncbi:MAG TPA: biotin/lipoyl-containing protein, partial [Candidatus Cybelea sp.]